jgi:hypothetical protein
MYLIAVRSDVASSNRIYRHVVMSIVRTQSRSCVYRVANFIAQFAQTFVSDAFGDSDSSDTTRLRAPDETALAVAGLEQVLRELRCFLLRARARV